MSLINKNESNNTRKNILKGLIVLLIIGVIGSIGYIKNSNINNDKDIQENLGINPKKNDEPTSEINSNNENVNTNNEENKKEIVVDNSNNIGLDATNNFNLDELKTYGLPMILDFGSDSCIPCKEMKPTLEELNEQLQGKAVVKFVDVWKNQDAAKNLPIRVIPTQFFFDKDGKPYVPSGEQTGFTMYNDKDTGEHLFTVHEGDMDKESILKVLKEMGVE